MVMQGYMNSHDRLLDTHITSKVVMPPTRQGSHLRLNVKFKPTVLAHQELNLQTNHSQSCNQKINVV